MSDVADTRRLNPKPQDLNDAYGPPSNFLEIDVYNPQVIGFGRGRYTTYEVHMRVRYFFKTHTYKEILTLSNMPMTLCVTWISR